MSEEMMLSKFNNEMKASYYRSKGVSFFCGFGDTKLIQFVYV